MMTAAGRTILIVDDEVSLLSLWRSELQEKGFAVLTAGSADEALQVCTRFDGPIDLLIVDIFLPQQLRLAKNNLQTPTKSGLHLARRFTALRPGIGVVFVSSHTDEEIRSLGGIPAGCAFLRKPFPVHMLMSTIHQMFQRSTAPGQPGLACRATG